jgi:hypothetical protein
VCVGRNVPVECVVGSDDRRLDRRVIYSEKSTYYGTVGRCDGLMGM